MPRIRKRKFGPGVPPPQENKPYRDASRFLKETFGTKVFRACVDGGFTCPNRDGTCGTGGCIFCGARGAGEFIPPGGIHAQIADAMEKARKKHSAQRFFVYFQNFTNTYAPVEVLRARYDEALRGEPDIVGLAVGTRPDCVTEEVAQLLAEYREKYAVWVELGLQTSDDRTAERCHRGYPSAEFTRAVEILNRHRLDVIVHILLGLPGETRENVRNTVAFLNRHDYQGIKIHSLYVQSHTQLAEMYHRGEFENITMAESIDWTIDVLTRIPPWVVVHRLTGDCARDTLVAPAWNLKKAEILETIQKRMEENGLSQGCYYSKVGYNNEGVRGKEEQENEK